jgi:hypothetical protein
MRKPLQTATAVFLPLLLVACATPQPCVLPEPLPIPSPPAVPMPPSSGTYSAELMKKREDWRRLLTQEPTK